METYRVLVTEDDEDTARVVSVLLAKLGHAACGVASNGEEAIDMAGRLRPDVVLMDIMLGRGMNGVEAAREIISRFDLPVVYLTGSGPEIVDEASLSGAHGFIAKPVAVAELAAGLRIAVHKHSMEKLVRASEEKYRLLFNNAAAGIYTAHPDGRVLEVNEKLAHMLGYDSPAQVLELVKNLDVQFYVDSSRRSEMLAELEAEGEVAGFESEVFGRDGDVIWLSEHCRRQDMRTQEGLYEAVALDITARKDAEQARDTALAMLQGVMDAMSDLVFLTDLDQQLILCNGAFCEHAGADADAILGQTCGEVFPEFKSFSADAPVTGDGKVYFTDPNGRYHMSMSPYHDQLGDIIGMVYVCRDVQSMERRKRGGGQRDA